MQDRILLVDDAMPSRIVLKVKLAAGAYRVAQADTLAEASAQLAAHPPALILLSEGILAGDNGSVQAFFRRVTGLPAAPPVVVMGDGAGPGGAPAARLAALAAGAADYLTRPVNGPLLLARVRSLIRRRGRPTGDLGGLAEPPAPFLDVPGRIALISADREDALRLKAALARDRPHTVTLHRPADAFVGIGRAPQPDLILLAARHLIDLRLLAEFRARPDTQRLPVLVLAGDDDPEFTIMALDLGAEAVVPPGAGPAELPLRLDAALDAKRRADRRRRALDDQLRLASTDPLTGLANRRATLARLDALQAEAARGGAGYGLLALDLDRFKAINDAHGHAAGDAVLAEVAHRLGRNLRRCDLMGRIGGEEFLCLLPGATRASARAAAERLRRAIEVDPIRLPGGAEIWVTMSVGVCLSDGSEPADVVRDRADRGLYEAKRKGRNTVRLGRPAA